MSLSQNLVNVSDFSGMYRKHDDSPYLEDPAFPVCSPARRMTRRESGLDMPVFSGPARNRRARDSKEALKKSNPPFRVEIRLLASCEHVRCEDVVFVAGEGQGVLSYLNGFLFHPHRHACPDSPSESA